MTQQLHSHPVQNIAGWSLLALAVPLLAGAFNPAWQEKMAPILAPSFLHNAIEMFVVVVAMLVFMTGYRAILSSRKGAVVLLGVAFLGVGLFDYLHVISGTDMPAALTANTEQKALFFSLTARLLAANALLVYALLPVLSEVTLFKKRLALVLMLAVVGVIGAVGLAWPEHLPDLYKADPGQVSLKSALEWLFIGINGATLGVLWHRRAELFAECTMALGFAVAFSGVAELFFTLLAGVNENGANVFGHFYKLVSYLYLFHATFNESLRRPLDLLKGQHQRERLVLSSSPDGVLWVDQKGFILMVNPAMEKLTGYSELELIGQNVDLFLPEYLRERHAHSMRDYFTRPRSRVMGSMDLQLMRRDGELLPVDVSLGHWEDEGKHHAIAYIRDLTERKKFEASLKYQATHDELTGLPNRWLFRMQLGQAMARATRANLRVAVLFLDLDDFKIVNDSFGHASGDALLVQVGDRLRGVLRENDTLARLGGDEFAILLTDLVNLDDAVHVASKLLVALESAYRLKDQDIYSGGSLGLAFYPDDAKDSDTLLRYADMAMYQAKKAGRGAYACYSSEMDRHVHEDMQMHTRLKEALAEGALELHYQPQVNVQTGTIVGAEALLRWHDPVLGHVSPARFIPVAEATGLILPLSDWVLETACTQIAAWTQAGSPLRVAVNVSSQQFRQRDLPEKVRATLERTGALAQWLDIEITESVAMTQPEQAREQLNALVDLGCRIALDDFGTGYSSLAYLKALPVSKLKIDKSFMDGIPKEANDAAIAKAIIALAHSLGMNIVAEGVETDAQLAFLRQYGCEVYQGWLFAKAMKPADLSALMQAAKAA